ncbi:bromodomain-containing protein 3 [Microdochium nivale]|nr:bromodomain-containing protein 3 [Microdochium nivale]
MGLLKHLPGYGRLARKKRDQQQKKHQNQQQEEQQKQLQQRIRACVEFYRENYCGLPMSSSNSGNSSPSTAGSSLKSVFQQSSESSSDSGSDFNDNRIVQGVVSKCDLTPGPGPGQVDDDNNAAAPVGPGTPFTTSGDKTKSIHNNSNIKSTSLGDAYKSAVRALRNRRRRASERVHAWASRQVYQHQINRARRNLAQRPRHHYSSGAAGSLSHYTPAGSRIGSPRYAMDIRDMEVGRERLGLGLEASGERRRSSSSGPDSAELRRFVGKVCAKVAGRTWEPLVSWWEEVKVESP